MLGPANLVILFTETGSTKMNDMRSSSTVTGVAHMRLGTVQSSVGEENDDWRHIVL